MRGMRVERLDHLGIVAEVCREIGVAEWLNAQDTRSRQKVPVGTATVAMVLNGLGFSNRQTGGHRGRGRTVHRDRFHRHLHPALFWLKVSRRA
jgi:hypothetical protein